MCLPYFTDVHILNFKEWVVIKFYVLEPVHSYLLQLKLTNTVALCFSSLHVFYSADISRSVICHNHGVSNYSWPYKLFLLRICAIRNLSL